MRDLMAVTARPEVISLAGGLPDTSTFPPSSFAAQMTRIAQESSAQALQYGPTEGFDRTKECIAEVMAAEGMSPDPEDIIVTTGGQQAIDLVAKTLLDPDDPVICEAPTYPGAVPVFCSYQAETIQVPIDEDGMRIDALTSTLEALDRRRAQAQVHLHRAELPEPRRGHAVRGARPPPRRDRPRAGDPDHRGQPLRPAALRGRRPRSPLQARRRRLRHLPWDVLEDPLPGHPPRLGRSAAAGDGEDRARQAGRPTSARPRSPSTSWPSTSRPSAGRRTWRASSRSTAAAATPWSTRSSATSRTRRAGPSPRAACSCGRTLPAYIDTTDLLARALRENVAFVPGAAAFVDGRVSSSMRLNFSGSTEEEIVEGIRRIGEVVTRAGRPVRIDHGRVGLSSSRNTSGRPRTRSGRCGRRDSPVQARTP